MYNFKITNISSKRIPQSERLFKQFVLGKKKENMKQYVSNVCDQQRDEQLGQLQL